MLQIILIAIALSLDAFGVTLGWGCSTQFQSRERASIIFSFGFFQFLFTFLGALLGGFINNNVFNISGYVSGAVILLLGIILLKEGFEEDEDKKLQKLNFWTYIILGISVSIDALGVGFSLFYNINFGLLVGYSVLIGVVTSSLTFVSIILCHYIRNLNIVEKYADYLGGVILIIFGLNMIF